MDENELIGRFREEIFSTLVISNAESYEGHTWPKIKKIIEDIKKEKIESENINTPRPCSY